ncbi:MAG: glycosyltransferase family 39 protein [Candidatus Electrothrix gigas]
MKDSYQLIHSKRFTVLIVCLVTITALFLRVEYVEQTVIHTPIRADARQYVIYGYNIYSHGIFSKELSSDPSPDSFRSPGYPLLISLAVMLGGKNGFYPIVIYFQAILSALLVPLTFFIGIRFLSRFWAMFAAILVAISPHLISMTSYLLTETLFSFILLSAIISFYWALEKKHLFYFVLSGLLFGFAYLTNETALFLPFLFVIVSIYSIYYLQHINISRKILINIFVYLIIFSSFPALWIWRSHNLGSETAKGSSRAIATMSHGAYPDFIYKSEKFKYFPYREDPMQPVFGSTFNNFSKILLERFQERPARYLSWYFLEKPYYLWSWNILQGQGDIYIYPVKTSFYYLHPSANLLKLLMKYFHTIILIATFSGILIIINENFRKISIHPLLNIQFIIIIYYTLLYTVFAPWPRYSVPLRPELYLFALCTFQSLTTYLRDWFRTIKLTT